MNMAFIVTLIGKVDLLLGYWVETSMWRWNLIAVMLYWKCCLPIWTDRFKVSFLRSEPIPVFGRIIHTKDDMMFREIAFDEAYLYFHEESMSAEGNAPMITRFLISPTRLDINRTVRMDRRVSTTYGFWWEEYKEEENFKVITRVLEEGSVGEIVEVYWKDANSHQRINEFPHNGIATLCAVVKHATEGDKVNFILEFDDGTFKRFSGVVDSRGIVEVKNVKLL